MRGLKHKGALVAALLIAATFPALADIEERFETLQESKVVLDDLVRGPDSEIPDHILKRAEAIVIIPKLAKGGFIIGAEHGTGVLTVRDRTTNTWSVPAFMKLTGGSIGWQIGFTSVDLVLLVMNTNAIDDLLANEFTLGANASVAAGPVGRSAEASTDATLTAQILAYSRAKGLFAGATIEGAKLGDHRDANREVYGHSLSAKELLAGSAEVKVPAPVDAWRRSLAEATGSAR
jgi:lipid-binding SYLF domain-containing protein